MGLLDGRIVVVTGGASGIGKATALAFAREEAKVVVSDINVKNGEEVAELARKDGGESIFVRADVTKEKDVEALVNTAVESYERLDCAFNNAGGGPARSLLNCSEENWDNSFSINLKSIWLCMKHEVSQMIKQGGGAIVNTSSIAGMVPQEIMTPAPYSVSKSGVIHITRIAAREFRSSGIRVNAVSPDFINTPMAALALKVMPAWKDMMREMESKKMMGEPRDVAEVVWLCSDAARFITGQILAIDGGYTLGPKYWNPAETILAKHE